MVSEIDHILSAVYRELETSRNDDASLMSGKAGHVLYGIQYLENNAGATDDDWEKLNNRIQDLAEKSITAGYPSFSNGMAGIHWVFSYFQNKGLLDEEEITSICSQDEVMATVAIDSVKSGLYDYLFGASGIAHYLLHRNHPPTFFKQLLDALRDQQSSSTLAVLPAFDLVAGKTIADRIDFGLAHGISAILKFHLQCFRKGVYYSESKNAAENIIDFLLSGVNDDKSYSYFPSIKETHSRTDSPSRLAWCYGDLTIAYMLYEAGILFHDKRLVDFSIEVFTKTTTRKTFDETGVCDAGLCHGSAGLAHIYSRVFTLTNEPLFKHTSEYWIKKTIEFANLTGKNAIFKKYNPHTNQFEPAYGLLEGSCGIALALSGFVTGQLDWDYCLMLNNG